MRKIAFVVLILAAVLGAWLWMSTAPEHPAATTQRDASPAQAPTLPQVKKPRVAVPRPPARPVATRTSAPEPAAVEPAPPGAGPVDRRPPEERGGGDEMARLRPHIDAVTGSVGECIRAWMELDPTLNGEVLLTFQIGPEGLQQAWVDNYDAVPDGPLTCFASAVYDEDWSGIAENPAEVTMPFRFNGGPD